MKEGEKVDSYMSRTLVVVNKMKISGEQMEASAVVGKILRSMTPWFNYVVCSIEESHDLNTLSINELHGSLLVHEQRMQGKEDKEQALKVVTTGQGLAGKEESRFSPRGRGRGNFRAYYVKEAVFNKDEEMLLMSYVELQNSTREAMWFLDSGCSNHMSGDKRWFVQLDQSFRQWVKLGNGSKMTVMGKRSIRMQVDGRNHTITKPQKRHLRCLRNLKAWLRKRMGIILVAFVLIWVESSHHLPSMSFEHQMGFVGNLLQPTLHNKTSVINRCLTSAIKDMTPEEAWSGIKPSVEHFKVFGCIGHVHIPDVKRRTPNVEIQEQVNNNEEDGEDHTTSVGSGTSSGADSGISSSVDSGTSSLVNDQSSNSSSSNSGSPNTSPVQGRIRRQPPYMEDFDTFRMILALAASKDWEVYQLDVKSAFLHGEISEKVYVEQPQGYEVHGACRLQWLLISKKVWKSVRYCISKGFDTTYWSLVE
nr:hypothetical protein [Tanacetum cinerariifolium]